MAHTISVTVKNERENVLYQQEFNLEDEESEEDTESFTGDPTIISIAVDNDSPTEHSWPKMSCEEQGKRSAGGIGVYLTPENGLVIESTCNTVYAK